jgi:GxxExxY protein
LVHWGIQNKITTKDTMDTNAIYRKINMESKNFVKKGMDIKPIPQETEEVARKILDAAFKVHTTLGPGLLESVYETCLAHELKRIGLKFEAQTTLPIIYEDITVESGLRIDLIVEKCVIIEIKAVETVIPVHKAQLLTYLKLSGVRLGLLINFNVIHLRNGITRVVN